MGVYIKGIEMPTGNAELRLIIHSNGQVIISHKTHYEEAEAVPVPPHGDLIDRNKLYEKTAEWEAQALHMVEAAMRDENTTEWRKWSTVLTERSAFKFDVADAPTIIPAEEGE